MACYNCWCLDVDEMMMLYVSGDYALNGDAVYDIGVKQMTR